MSRLDDDSKAWSKLLALASARQGRPSLGDFTPQAASSSYAPRAMEAGSQTMETIIAKSDGKSFPAPFQPNLLINGNGLDGPAAASSVSTTGTTTGPSVGMDRPTSTTSTTTTNHYGQQQHKTEALLPPPAAAFPPYPLHQHVGPSSSLPLTTEQESSSSSNLSALGALLRAAGCVTKGQQQHPTTTIPPYTTTISDGRLHHQARLPSMPPYHPSTSMYRYPCPASVRPAPPLSSLNGTVPSPSSSKREGTLPPSSTSMYPSHALPQPVSSLDGKLPPTSSNGPARPPSSSLYAPAPPPHASIYPGPSHQYSDSNSNANLSSRSTSLSSIMSLVDKSTPPPPPPPPPPPLQPSQNHRPPRMLNASGVLWGLYALDKTGRRHHDQAESEPVDDDSETYNPPTRYIKKGKGSWKAEEDDLVRVKVAEIGQDWPKIVPHLPGRTTKQVRERYLNNLDPQLKKEVRWSEREKEILIEVYHRSPNKWVKISSSLPGRSANDVKNHWHSRDMKRLVAEITGQEPLGRGGGEGYHNGHTPSLCPSRSPYPATLLINIEQRGN